ncbi:MAG: hypothetical protein HRU09_14510 [Oligoflexales bacterium]|nr:hypothetical protein [Oligoflexales bacterium]
MIKPEIKGEIYLQDMGDFKTFKPEDSENFSVIVEVGIGEVGKDGFDNYTVNVCTPNWLKEDLTRNGKPIFVKGTLLVERFDPILIARRINEVVKSTSGKDWADCNLKLVSYFNWEFEGYQPFEV